ncbi:MAG TPA: 1-acyl-sn-glycerol-3-phosphate acyltransferase [Gaiellaceae bacterium]|nr:1-acyl-sn-glycerol-3-phosphate acyltransferase [Gaiellaceae bacterium]
MNTTTKAPPTAGIDPRSPATVLAPPSRTADVPPPASASDPFDAEWARSIERNVLAPMTDSYFRAELIGGERIPARGPVVLAANHSGNAFPYDGIVLDALLWRRDGMRDEAKFRTVYEYQLSLRWWMRPYGIRNFWRRGGGVDMTFDNFDRLLARGDRVLYFPEGVPGIGKGFNRRYQLQRFSSSFVLLAARHHAPVLPLYVINAEWLHPFGYCIRPLDWVMQRVFLVPFLPLPIGLLAILMPWMWFLAFPVRLVFVVGDPIDVAGELRAVGVTDLEAPPRDRLRQAAERVRERMQKEITALVAVHGRTRYGFPSLLRSLRRARPHALRATPLGWPLAFIQHERDRERPPARSRLHAILRDWDLIGFYLPLGWPLLTLARRLRKPPYGYRGLSREEVRRREGQFVWKLAEEPVSGKR